MQMLFFIAFSLVLLSACNKTDTPETNKNAASGTPIVNSDAFKSGDTLLEGIKQIAVEDGEYCFKKMLNKDVTDVQLRILGNVVTGKMNWLPYEKDSAKGTLKGQFNKAGELELLYDYMIEGNKQTETKIMKIENKKLMLKVGELLDPNNDGNLIYKDVVNAQYSEILERIACEKLADY